MDSFDMLLHVGRIKERFITNITLEGFYSGMSPYVLQEVPRISEVLATDRTRVQTGAAMRIQVLRQRELRPEILLAKFALKRLLPRVQPLVDL